MDQDPLTNKILESILVIMVLEIKKKKPSNRNQSIHLENYWIKINLIRLAIKLIKKRNKNKQRRQASYFNVIEKPNDESDEEESD